MRTVAIATSLLVCVSTGCLGSGSSGGSHPASVPIVRTAFSGSARSCPNPRSYTPRLSAAKGPAGSVLTLSGRLPLRGEDGRIEPAGFPTQIAVWWDLPPGRWTSVLGRNTAPAAARLLLSVRVPRPMPCDYRVAVRVPSVAQGSHPVVMILAGGGGWAPLRSNTFRVVSD